MRTRSGCNGHEMARAPPPRTKGSAGGGGTLSAESRPRLQLQSRSSLWSGGRHGTLYLHSIFLRAPSLYVLGRCAQHSTSGRAPCSTTAGITTSRTPARPRLPRPRPRNPDPPPYKTNRGAHVSPCHCIDQCVRNVCRFVFARICGRVRNHSGYKLRE